MKIEGMRIAGGLAACLLGLVTLAQPGRMMAQAAAAATASIHGHVTSPLGQAIKEGDVRLTTDRSPNSSSHKWEYTFPLDANGDYKGTGIKPGNYLGVVFQNNSTVDFMPAQLAAGVDKTVDFDMSRKEYIDKMSPAEREQMEQTKKANAEIMAKNAKIENLNALLKQARADTAAGNYAPAIKAMTDATAAKPDEAILWDTLGDAQLGEAGAASNAAKAAKTTDASVPAKLAGGGGLLPEGSRSECRSGQAQPGYCRGGEQPAWAGAGQAGQNTGCFGCLRCSGQGRPQERREVLLQRGGDAV
jgi:hypothetical protein